MRTSPFLLALPALAVAQQAPLFDQAKAWFAKATDSLSAVLPKATNAVPNIPNPLAAAGASIAALNVEPITKENYAQLLTPGAATATPGTEEWMILVTGGNKTCFGSCGRTEIAFNESTALIKAAPRVAAPNLGLLNCEADGQLCAGWGASPPTILYFHLPQPLADQTPTVSDVRYISVNRTAVTATEIASIVLQGKWKETEAYEGVFHPFDGQFAKLGLTLPIGYIIWGFGQVPSWMIMIGISFFSRTFMRRPQPGGNAPAAAPAAAR